MMTIEALVKVLHLQHRVVKILTGANDKARVQLVCISSFCVVFLDELDILMVWSVQDQTRSLETFPGSVVLREKLSSLQLCGKLRTWLERGRIRVVA
jgi:hypothetical protein